jgi:hypothetical protein
VEAIGAVISCIIAGAIGFHAGGRWAPGPIVSGLIGLVIGAVVAVAYFALALWVGETWPHMLNARTVGLMSAGLVVAAALVGAVCAWFGYRKSLGAKLF